MDKKNLSPLGNEIAASLDELIDALKKNEPLENRFKVRTPTNPKTETDDTKK